MPKGHYGKKHNEKLCFLQAIYLQCVPFDASHDRPAFLPYLSLQEWSPRIIVVSDRPSWYFTINFLLVIILLYLSMSFTPNEYS